MPLAGETAKQAREVHACAVLAGALVDGLGRAAVGEMRLVGVEITFHDLRHTAATLAAISGATTKELMARLGHSSQHAALIYQHATADRDAAIAEALSGMVTAAGLAPVVELPRDGSRLSGREEGVPMASAPLLIR